MNEQKFVEMCEKADLMTEKALSVMCKGKMGLFKDSIYPFVWVEALNYVMSGEWK